MTGSQRTVIRLTGSLRYGTGLSFNFRVRCYDQFPSIPTGLPPESCPHTDLCRRFFGTGSKYYSSHMVVLKVLVYLGLARSHCDLCRVCLSTDRYNLPGTGGGWISVNWVLSLSLLILLTGVWAGGSLGNDSRLKGFLSILYSKFNLGSNRKTWSDPTCYLFTLTI